MNQIRLSISFQSTSYLNNKLLVIHISSYKNAYFRKYDNQIIYLMENQQAYALINHCPLNQWLSNEDD